MKQWDDSMRDYVVPTDEERAAYRTTLGVELERRLAECVDEDVERVYQQTVLDARVITNGEPVRGSAC
jgi:hypothetical protein